MFSILRFVDVSKLTISPPKEIGGPNVGRWYQYIQYGDNRTKLFVETPLFISTGPIVSKFKENTRQMVLPASVVSEVVKIDQFAKANVQLPANAPAIWRQQVSSSENGDISTIYKSLDPERVYVTLADNLRIFNTKREAQADDLLLQTGEYRCMIQIRGVYHGAHGPLPKFISLQLRVVQLMYTPIADWLGSECMFLASDDVQDHAQETGASPAPEPAQVSVPQIANVWSMALGPENEVVAAEQPNPPPFLQRQLANTPTTSGVSSSDTTTTTTTTTPAGIVEQSTPYPVPANNNNNTNKGRGSRKRKRVLPPLTMPSREEKRAAIAAREDSQTLMRQYMSLDYPTQEQTVEELADRLARRDEVAQKLVALLGPEWETEYYSDFHAAKMDELYPH